ncbi:MAG TPA: cysteine-rich CWC family protein, partial [Burkholderiaceae bacterium]
MAPDDARCPRCGDGFHCGINDTAPCACTTLQLN